MTAIRLMDPMLSASPVDPLVLGMALDCFAVYSSLALIFGVGAFATLLAPERVACEIMKRLRLSLGTAIAVFVLGTFLWLLAGSGPDLRQLRRCLPPGHAPDAAEIRRGSPGANPVMVD
jgi:hypothetical protein